MPPPPTVQVPPASTKLPPLSIWTQWPFVSVPDEVAKVEVLPDAVPEVKEKASRADGSVPVTVDVLSASVNPAPVAPPVNVPTPVSDDPVTFEASVVPVTGAGRGDHGQRFGQPP